jgi:SAM-dependent methyltransferase
MVSFHKAVENKKKILADFISPGMKYAADLGCGSGTDSIAISSAGLRVAAFDLSNEMLNAAKSNAENVKAKITFHNYPIEGIPDDFNNQFDLAVSLGNTFANIPKEKLNDSLKKSFQLLKPNGVLLIQIVNYEKIIAEKSRIINITEGNDKYYIRFYDFTGGELIFNILSFSKQNLVDSHLISTLVFPHSQTDFISAFKRLGVHTFQFFSDFELHAFNATESKDLIIKAFKN